MGIVDKMTNIIALVVIFTVGIYFWKVTVFIMSVAFGFGLIFLTMLYLKYRREELQATS